MSPFLRKKVAVQRPQTAVLLDIGSGSVGAALVEITHGRSPHVLAYKRIALKLAHHRSGLALQEQTFRAAAEALHALRMHARRRTIHRALVFLPAPWATLALHTVRFSQDKAFLANTSLMNRLLAEHMRESSISKREKQSEEKVFERIIAGIRLNGYVSPSLPEQAEVFRVEMMLAASEAPGAFLQKLTALCNDEFTDTDISFHSSVISGAHALTSLATDTPSFLLCDGEGELAELLLVKDTIPEAHATIPVGYATILRTIAMHAGLTHEELPSMLALITDPRSLVSAVATEAITLAKTECAAALGKAEPVCSAYAPRVCYLIGEGPEVQWFAEALEHSPRLKLALPRDFGVRTVGTATLRGHVDFREGKGDAMLGLQALFAADRFSGKAESFYTNV